jgi:hypothetical protein
LDELDVLDELDALDDEPDAPDEVSEPDSESLDELLLFAGSSFRAAAGFDVLDRSFFAQPEPLNTIAGGANAFVIVPSAPHSGQNFGPLSWIPWTTSVRWPQLLHT